VVAPDGRRAVWFFSLDVSRLLPALVARVGYGLPYHWGPMSIDHTGTDTIEYVSERRWPRPGARSRLVVRIGHRIADAELTSLEQFVTARWALASEFVGVGLWAEVDHPPWPLHRAELVHLDEDLVVAAGLPTPSGDPLVLWSPGVEVRIGRPVRGSRRRGPAARCAPAPASR
ncbi:MAG: YqjF family protein, partial [Microthrixaceae bacterium]